MFRNMKLGTKIAGLAAFLIIISIILAVVGSRGISTVVDRLEKADDVNRLIKQVLMTRQYEKNYIMRGDNQYAEQVHSSVEEIRTQANNTKSKFNDPVNKRQMDDVLSAVNKYQSSFSQFTEERKKVTEADAEMVKAARELRNMADNIREEQKVELETAQKQGDEMLNDKLAKADDANRIIKWALESRREEKNYIIRRENSYAREVKKRIEQIINLANDMKSRFEQEKNKAQADSIIQSAIAYQNAFNAYMISRSDRDENLMLENARKLIEKANEIREEQKNELEGVQAQRNAQTNDKLTKADDANRIIKWALESRREEKNYLLRGDKSFADNVNKNVNDIIDLANDIKTRFKQDKNKAQADSIIVSAQAYKAAFEETISLKDSQKEAEADMLSAARLAQEICDKAREDQKNKMNSQISYAVSTMTVVTLLAVGFGILLSFVIIRGITKAITRIAEGLAEGSEQVASAANQVSSASQQLAEGASEQAASIEETSSSLEEVSAMTKQNANNAGQANNLMKEANQIVEKANHAMNDLTHSMKDISKAGEETSKIIKTIDEIAFQTNLLALNAAVEAARAGEAGAGFAVVADEVRNLAMRAADAAKSTAGLIEGTVKKVGDGSDLVAKTNDAFVQVSESSKKVGELVSEIAVASDEQAEGIEQVNKAVQEMDKVVQQNAANAEESASASEELNAQAEQMKSAVGGLLTMVGGKMARNRGFLSSTTKNLLHKTHLIRTAPQGAAADNRNPIRQSDMETDMEFNKEDFF